MRVDIGNGTSSLPFMQLDAIAIPCPHWIYEQHHSCIHSHIWHLHYAGGSKALTLMTPGSSNRGQALKSPGGASAAPADVLADEERKLQAAIDAEKHAGTHHSEEDRSC